MPYSTSFENDVFISYAHDNNHQGWVSELKVCLEPLLREKLRRAGSRINVWMDNSDLRGNKQLTPEIAKTVKSSATLVIILSEAYLASSWCRRERKLFVENFGGLSAVDERLFVIQYEDIPVEKRPPELQVTTGYRFFHRDEDIDVVLPMSNDSPETQKQAFNKEMYCLRRDLVETLKQPDKPNVRPGGNVNAPTVFLAEVTPDLYHDRTDVETFLTQKGYNVVPNRPYYHTPEGFEDAVGKHMADSDLFVQLLGQFHFPPTEELPNGFEQWQTEQARAKSRTCLRWRSRSLDVRDLMDESHRKFVDAADVMACDMAELKRAIVETVDRLGHQESVEVGEAGSIVLVNASDEDKNLADEVGALIEELALEADEAMLDAAIVPEQARLDAIAGRQKESGLLVLYGACPKNWTQERMRDCRRVALKLKQKIKACAVYVTESYDKDPLDLIPPRFDIIRHGDQAALRTFIGKMAAMENGA